MRTFPEAVYAELTESLALAVVVFLFLHCAVIITGQNILFMALYLCRMLLRYNLMVAVLVFW